MTNQNKEWFYQLYAANMERKGYGLLLEFIESSDFFTAPASTKYHGAYEGGLLEHSLCVYDVLNNQYKRLKTVEANNGEADEIDRILYDKDGLFIVSIFHDLCKVNKYVRDYKNIKTYNFDREEAERKFIKIYHDNKGDFIWETIDTYSVNEDFLYGHGEKSVYLLNKFIALSDEEAQAIRFHMGTWEETTNANIISQVYSKNPLAYYLHLADEEATFIHEK